MTYIELSPTETGVVRYDAAQALTPAQRSQARANIDVMKKNYVVNGAMQINQEGYVSGAVLAAGSYGHDQWKAGTAGGDYSFTQSKASTTITIAAGKTLIQPIEDVRVTGGGTYVLAWTGTAQARAGVNTLTPAGAYAASPLAITGQTDGTVMSVEFNAGTLGNVSLTEGTVAPPFAVPDFASELRACQRYFEQVISTGGHVAWAPTATIARTEIVFKVTKRSAPTMTVPSLTSASVNHSGGNTAITAFTQNNSTTYSAYVDATTSGLTINTPNSMAYGNINFSARL